EDRSLVADLLSPLGKAGRLKFRPRTVHGFDDRTGHVVGRLTCLKIRREGVEFGLKRHGVSLLKARLEIDRAGIASGCGCAHSDIYRAAVATVGTTRALCLFRRGMPKLLSRRASRCGHLVPTAKRRPAPSEQVSAETQRYPAFCSGINVLRAVALLVR